MSDLVFKSSLTKVKVRFEVEDQEDIRAVLVELTGKRRDSYLQTLRDKYTKPTIGSKDGAREVTKLEGLMGLLVS